MWSTGQFLLASMTNNLLSQGGFEFDQPSLTRGVRDGSPQWAVGCGEAGVVAAALDNMLEDAPALQSNNFPSANFGGNQVAPPASWISTFQPTASTATGRRSKSRGRQGQLVQTVHVVHHHYHHHIYTPGPAQDFHPSENEPANSSWLPQVVEETR